MPRYLSPDGQHVADLVRAGEIRFGPFYYTLQVDGRAVADRTFGHAGEWSECSRFFAGQEWESTDRPSTHLFVADVERWLAARAASQPNGFLDPVVVIDLNLRYVRTVYGEGRPSVSWGEVYIPHVTDWFALGSEGLESAT
jgi:hypothetical protein